MENEPNFCSKELNDICEKVINDKNISNQCTKYCPKDCIQFDIQFTRDYGKDSEKFTEETVFVWNQNYPLISYIETRVMTFTDYLCYCGGLFGLWFGSNANLVLNYALDSRNWISMKIKFIHIFQTILSMIWRILFCFLNFISKFHFRKEINLSIDTRAGKLKLEWT
jgi:hypothetical protein